MIGMTYRITRINEVNTMTTRQNDLVVKKSNEMSQHDQTLPELSVDVI